MITIHGLTAKRYSITAEGLYELRQQLTDLKKRRATIAAEIHDISSQNGTIGSSEDSILTDSQKRAAEIDDLITILERIIGLADVIEKPATNRKVQIGSRLSVLLNGTAHTYTIVGSIEANPAQGKISNESPLGQSLLGKKVNDQFEIIAPRSRQPKKATIMNIE